MNEPEISYGKVTMGWMKISNKQRLHSEFINVAINFFRTYEKTINFLRIILFSMLNDHRFPEPS